MKRLYLMAALLALSGCASNGMKNSAGGNPRTSRAEQSSHDGNPRVSRAEQSSHDGNSQPVGMTTETHGLKLVKRVAQLPGLKIEKISANAKFTQVLPILSGEDMRKAYQPAKLESSENYIIGINGKLGWKSPDELRTAVEAAYAGKTLTPMQVFSLNTGKLLQIVAGDGHSLGDLSLTPADLTLDVSEVAEVSSGSWAERSGLQKGDEMIGNAEFRGATIRRSNVPFLTYGRDETSTVEVSSAKTEELNELFDRMFRKVAPYMPTWQNRDGLMGDVGMLRVTLMRGSTLAPKELSHSRYVGLGVLFGCIPYCGSASPAVKAMRENSSGGRSGLRLEDTVWSVNGKRVWNSWDTTKLIRKYNYGDEITLRVIRDGKPVDITMKVDWVIED